MLSFNPISQISLWLEITRAEAIKLFIAGTFTSFVAFIGLTYLFLWLVAPIPRAPEQSERRYKSVQADTVVTQDLPCWLDAWGRRHQALERARAKENESAHGIKVRGQRHIDKVSADKEIDPSSLPLIDEATCGISLVVPAYNEEERLRDMLEEAVDVLENWFGDGSSAKATGQTDELRKRRVGAGAEKADWLHREAGWEILVVSDGSRDKTVEVALDVARSLTTPQARQSIRVIELAQNRGKGGAVTHGMRHARGKYVVFADADGASRFSDLKHLMQECDRVADSKGRAVAVGSRAHLVGSEAVVKRSYLRNLLMHSFHLLIRILTPPSTGIIKDTQCGFKLFSRAAMPYIVPFMHSEGWIFDVEMLMLAEASSIPVAEVPIGWKEVKGSKLNVVWDSLGMAWGLAILRAAWLFGIYDHHSD